MASGIVVEKGLNAPAPRRNLDDIFDVLLQNNQAIDQMTKHLVREIRISGMRNAAAAGDRSAEQQLERLQGLGDVASGGVWAIGGGISPEGVPAGVTTIGSLASSQRGRAVPGVPIGQVVSGAGGVSSGSSAGGLTVAQGPVVGAAAQQQALTAAQAAGTVPLGMVTTSALGGQAPPDESGGPWSMDQATWGQTVSSPGDETTPEQRQQIGGTKYPNWLTWRREQARKYGSQMQQNAKTAVGRTMGSVLRQSGGTLKGLMTSAEADIPGVGLAIGAVRGVTNTVDDLYSFGLNQTEQGRAYERIEGPMGTGPQQLERARSKIWRFQSLGESSGESAAQFENATKLGLRGSARSFALQQMYRQSTRLGMDPAQEAEVLQLAVQNAGVSLSNLTDSLTGVSQAAQDAHVNADTARDSFIKMMSTTLAQGFGPSAGALSQAVTTSMVAMGPQMQGADASGMFSQERMLALAGQSGMNPMQFAASNINDQGATFALASDRFTNQTLQGVLGAAWPLVQQTAMDNASAIMQDSNIAGTLAQRVISNPIFYQSVPSPQALMSVVAQLGGVQTTDVVQCVTWILQHLAGKTASGALAAQIGSTQTVSNAAANRQRGTNPSLLSSSVIHGNAGTNAWTGNNGEFNGAASAFVGAGRAWEAKSWRGDTRFAGDVFLGGARTLGGVAGSVDRALNPWYHGEKGAHTLSAIQSEEKATGRTSPVIESIYQRIKTTGMNPDDTMVEIQTSAGPIEIPLSEAVKNYPDSIASGQFTIKGHRYKDVAFGVHRGAFKYRGDDPLSGKSLAQLGITADTSQGVIAAATNEQQKAIAKDAKSAAQVNYQGGTKGMAQMFDLTPQAAAILTPLVQGSQTQGAIAASQGVPVPISTDASNPARAVQ